MIKLAIGAGLGLLVGGVVATLWTKNQANGNALAQFGRELDWTAQARLQAQTAANTAAGRLP